jgi:cyclopropane fatty-acyl-phospholipid synthase-like methyltransferase
MGSPYVPTKDKEAEFFLKEAKLKKGQIFYDIGCGDGRIVRTAVKEYQVKGTGIDINPLLIWLAKFLAKTKKVKNVEFITKNIFDVDLRKVDVLYIFLMPKLIEKIFPKLKKELKKGALVISHGFVVEGLKKNLIHKIDHTPFPTYFYRV